MLTIKDSIENSYKKVFLVMCIFQIIILVVTIIFYNANKSQVFSEMKSSYESNLVYNMRILEDYLNQKYSVILQDLSLLAKYFQANRYYIAENLSEKEIIDSLIDDECWFMAHLLKESNEDKIEVIDMPDSYNSSKITINTTRLRVQVWAGKSVKTPDKLLLADKINVLSYCKIRSLMIDFLYKHAYWTDRSPMTYNYFHSSFSTGLFIKIPYAYTSNFNITEGKYIDSERKDGDGCLRKKDDYDPRCRPFYKNAYNEKIPNKLDSFIVPYLFFTGLIGSEICIKNFDMRSNSSIISSHPVSDNLFCLVYNFNEFDLLINISSKLSGNFKLSLVIYSPKISTKLATIYSSSLASKNYASYGKKLEVKSSYLNKFLDADDLFETLHFDIFSKAFNYMSNSTDAVRLNDSLKTMYQEVNENYNKHIFSNFKNLSDNYDKFESYDYNQLLKMISDPNTGNVKLNDSYYFNEENGQIEKYKNLTYYYILPLKVNASVNNDYTLGNKSPAQFFVVYVRSEEVSQ